MGLRRALMLVLPSLAGLAHPAAASASLTFGGCGRPGGIRCATLSVPIDRSGHVSGSFSLHVERIRGGGRAALLALAGGPGETNTAFTLDFALRLRPALRSHDLYVFDQRGTGASGAIHCPAFEDGQPVAQSVPQCATALGPRRNYFTTLASAQDIESLGRALGVQRLAIYAVSYGTYVAQAYASLYPSRVESLVLDSAYAPSNSQDAFNVGLFKALPGVLGAICAHGACRGIISDFATRTFSLLGSLGKRPLAGTYYDTQGRAVPEQITNLGVALSFPNLDLRPNLRAELPRAIAGALKGDTAPLARLVAGTAAGVPTAAPEQINETLNLATQCEERNNDFSRTASPAGRLAQAQAALAKIPASEFAPLSPPIAFAASLVPECAYWPSLPTAPTFPTGRLPAVPALILSGQQDVRTSTTKAREVARRLPRARLLVVPFSGHAVVQADDSGCALQALAAFYAGRRVQNCAAAQDPYAPRPLAPTALTAVSTAAGFPTPAGRIVSAAELTVQDAFEQVDPGIFHLEGLSAAGGLRGGSYRVASRGLLLDHDVYVPGVAVSGLVPANGTAHLTLSGAVSGTLAFTSSGLVSGQIAGRRIQGRASIVRETVSQQLRQDRLRRFHTAP